VPGLIDHWKLAQKVGIFRYSGLVNGDFTNDEK
jgi:hypothetical protein